MVTTENQHITVVYRVGKVGELGKHTSLTSGDLVTNQMTDRTYLLPSFGMV